MHECHAGASILKMYRLKTVEPDEPGRADRQLEKTILIRKQLVCALMLFTDKAGLSDLAFLN